MTTITKRLEKLEDGANVIGFCACTKGVVTEAVFPDCSKSEEDQALERQAKMQARHCDRCRKQINIQWIEVCWVKDWRAMN